MSVHYYEAHITVEPLIAESFSYEDFTDAVTNAEWRVSKFEHDDVDGIAGKWFLSTKAHKLSVMRARVLAALNWLRSRGLTVERWKIEAATLDSKYGDSEEALK